jgi:ferredoxin
MKRIKIYCFSGTGNTEIVCRMLEEGLTRLGCEVELEMMEKALKSGKPIDATRFDLIGIACPVIGYGIPRIVARFLRGLPKAGSVPAFIVRTAGGVAPGNYNASRGLRAKLGRLGYPVFYERIFSIGSNWIVRFSNAAMRALLEATKRKVALACRELLEGRERELSTSLPQRILMGAARGAAPLSLRFMAKDLRVGSACSGCGHCVTSCPMGNIRQTPDGIRFGADCSACMRCVYACPGRAIEFKSLKFFPVKGGYDPKGIFESPERWPDEGSRAEPPFLPAYVSDDDL